MPTKITEVGSIKKIHHRTGSITQKCSTIVIKVTYIHNISLFTTNLAQKCRTNLEQQNIHTVKTNKRHVIKHQDNWLLKSVTQVPYHIQVHKTTKQLLKYQLLLNI
jgi:hypothetical protein